MSRYAENTSVPSDRSRAEIEKTLTRYGATAFAYGWSGATAQIMFEIRTTRGGRRVRFALPMPDRSAPEFRLDEKLEAAGWAAGLDVWEQVGKGYSEWYLGDDTLGNAQLWSLREAIRAEHLAELVATGRVVDGG